MGKDEASVALEPFGNEDDGMVELGGPLGGPLQQDGLAALVDVVEGVTGVGRAGLAFARDVGIGRGAIGKDGALEAGLQVDEAVDEGRGWQGLGYDADSTG